ncbi:LysR family transcriptional regulator [Aminicella lysinilytica]|uniref:DNA-binding transcriptional LysR family regulator n=1 Tax=Aminicella lysinilytica TaxID=433323 RepID=A0A4R6Q235_9FIRM|nr:LysR family transcriptional regulator [Aminicella lysinilytica]TDP56290.1 DNA-binding transcriptional LysR family regulator [Aminicella lysinilytica]
MLSRYYIFSKVIETGSFTEAARELSYSQSAVSQTVKGLEAELGTTLVRRDRFGVTLTSDGESYMPFIRGICGAEEALREKKVEMEGLTDAVIRIGAFTSVSRTFLPQLMRSFKAKNRGVQFELLNGEYSSIERWIREGSVDLGFVNSRYAENLQIEPLYRNDMKAVLPQNHPLAAKDIVTLEELAREHFIELFEGDYSVSMDAFRNKGLSPDIEYSVQDDYSIITMVRQGLGVSMLYDDLLEGYSGGVLVRDIADPPRREIALGYKDFSTLPLAARRFMDYIVEHMKKENV